MRATTQIVDVADIALVVSLREAHEKTGAPMKDPHPHERELLLEAFNAGWQAALGIRISNPRVLAVMETCFEGWLLEAADEVEVFGLPFRRREELPALVRTRAPEHARVDEPSLVPEPVPEPVAEPAPPVAVPVAAFEERPPDLPRGGSWAASPAT